MPRSIAIDFGTTNSVLAVADDGGRVQLARFAQPQTTGHLGADTSSFRTILFYDPEKQVTGLRPVPAAGTDAIAAYLESYGEGRLVQSMKTYLSSRSLRSTQILGYTVKLEEMISSFLLELRRKGEAQLGELGQRVSLGRPVRFAGAKDEEDDAFALSRLEAAARRAGFEDIRFELEPIAAAYHYEQGLDHDALGLIADFGGGTSDFCLFRMRPSRSAADSGAQVDRTSDILATGGVGIAGDDFDAKLIRHLVAPALGRSSRYRRMGRALEVPPSFFARLERWHHLSFLKNPREMMFLEEVQGQADEPDKIAALIHIVEWNQGLHLHRAVQAAKIALSSEPEARLVFREGPVDIDARVTRAEFEDWIGEDLAAIAGCVDDVMARAGVTAADVEQVFVTGGSSFVPAVRGIFEQRFGAAKIRSGGEFVSIASGLALRHHGQA